MHNHAEYERRNQHLNQLDEGIAQRLQLHRDAGIQPSKQYADDEGNDDLPEQRAYEATHGASLRLPI